MAAVGAALALPSGVVHAFPGESSGDNSLTNSSSECSHTSVLARRELGIGFVPYSPLNRGFLGGCINEYTRFDASNDNRPTLPRFQPGAIRSNTRIVNVLQEFGRTWGMTSAQVALGWLLQKAPWIVPIPGTTKMSHLEENLRTLAFEVSAADWQALETAVAAIPVVGARYNAEQQRQVGF